MRTDATDREKEKETAARRSLAFVEDGMVVGLGTGSTATLAIAMLGAMVRGGCRLTAVPTSERTAALARECGIPLVTLEQVRHLDLAIDGADEIVTSGDALKGAGGALVREKIVAAASRRVVLIVDSGKVVVRLGTRPIPFEVVPFGWSVVSQRLGRYGFDVVLRRTPAGEAFRSDNGNYILDAQLRPGEVLQDEAVLRGIPGVVDHGLFCGIAHHLVIGRAAGAEVIDCKPVA